MKNKKWFFIWGGVALFAIWVVADYLQSCIKTEVEESAKTIYLGFENERMRYVNYIWVEVVAVTPTTEYYTTKYSVQ